MKDFYDELIELIDNRVPLSLKSLLNTARKYSGKVYSPVKMRYVSSGEAKIEIVNDEKEVVIWFSRKDIFCGTEVVKEEDTIIINEIAYSTDTINFNHINKQHMYDSKELRIIRKLVQMYSWMKTESAFFDYDLEEIKDRCADSKYFKCDTEHNPDGGSSIIRIFLKGELLANITIDWEWDDDEDTEDRMGEVVSYEILSDLII